MKITERLSAPMALDNTTRDPQIHPPIHVRCFECDEPVSPGLGVQVVRGMLAVIAHPACAGKR